MAYSPRAKKRIRNAVRRSEQLERGAGRGDAVGHPQPMYPFLLGKPVDTIPAGGTGKVIPQTFSGDDPDYIPEDEEDPGIPVLNTSEVDLVDDEDQLYLFAWVLGVWMPIWTNKCSEGS